MWKIDCIVLNIPTEHFPAKILNVKHQYALLHPWWQEFMDFLLKLQPRWISREDSFEKIENIMVSDAVRNSIADFINSAPEFVLSSHASLRSAPRLLRKDYGPVKIAYCWKR
jgi:hypothetical protein